MIDYDLCWLPREPLQGWNTYFLDPTASGPVTDGLRRELAASFSATETTREKAALVLTLEAGLPPEGFRLDWQGKVCTIRASDERGLLYGLYAVIRHLCSGSPGTGSVWDAPRNSLRMLNHWDRFSGDIERGYAGRSIFYEQGKFRNDFHRLEAYARILASVGINAISLNNVNVHAGDTALLTPDGLHGLRAYSDIFARYGIRSFLSVNFASPMIMGGLPTADPLDAGVADWWSETAARVYEAIPGFGGFLVKADSEGEPGPFTYGRDHAEGANMLADALAPFGGLLIWRCFVYNCLQDWRDRSTDRARAAYDTFMPLDGKFRDNAILQIKFGPLDFQVREPVSPLIAGLTQTQLIVEYQITQEYTGQQRHICYLPSQWKEILDFQTYAGGEESPVRSLTAGKPRCGMAAVASTGRDANWTGHKLAQANLYGFGRLAWDPCLTAEQILVEWICQSFSLNERQHTLIHEIMLPSHAMYEAYTVPLGVGFMCQPHFHYGPSVDGYEYDRWGTYHFADRDGIGNDRTQRTGTGYTAQYHEPNRSLYESLETCPDELLLFFHHVPYTHVLHSGKTVIQHIYDSHFAGVEWVERVVAQWPQLQGTLPEADYVNVRERLVEQLRCAREWRDQVNTYFFRKSGIADQQGRVIYR